MRELETSDDEPGYRFVLPARERRVPAAVAAGLMALVFLGLSLGPLAARVWEGGALGIVPVLLRLPFVAAGLALLGLALAALHSRSTLELTPDEARAIERVGPLRWTFRRPLRDLSGVAVAGFRPARARGARGEAARPALALRLDFDGAKPLWAAIGYPRERLVELAGHVRRAAPELARVSLDPAAPLVEEPAAERRLERARVGALEQPERSDIARRELPGGGFELDVPPAGIWRGSRGLVLVGLVFTLFGAGALAAAIAGGREALPIGLFALVFGGIGAGLVLTSVNLGRRTAVLRVERGELEVERASLFGRETRRFALEALDEVRVAPSGLRVNNVDVLELQLHAGGRKRMGLLSQRRDEELEWIAAQLTAALERAREA